uniref:Phosphomevalonate kinase n=2 Tax=Octopus bimaculoides TaxID=37653 RepID=A0A0L8FPA3_OCTBM
MFITALQSSSMCPEIIFILSGKRKSGKDYVASLMVQKLTAMRCGIMRLSSPIKFQYAKENKLLYEKLNDSSEYKEKYRTEMIKFGEEKRNIDPGYFCKLATSEEYGIECKKPIWIISDARRQTDLDYFLQKYTDRVQTVRITATEDIRKERGYIFTKGVDDAASECSLDVVEHWDFIIDNCGDSNQLNSQIDKMIATAYEKLK